MQLKCLILGACGFLGNELCEKLLKDNHTIIAYNHSSIHVSKFKIRFPDIPVIIGDFSKQTQEDFSLILNDVDVVFHLISTTNTANENILYDFESNVLPTIRFLEACKKNQVKKIVYFSSGGTVYGIPHYVPIDEEHQTDPISAYGIHKLALEKIIAYYGRVYNLSYIILRLANPYGPGQDLGKNQGLLGTSISKAFLGEPILIFGNGSIIRDYIFIDDVINACVQVIHYDGDYKIFNIGSGRGYSIREILNNVQRQTNIILDINYVNARSQDVPVNVLDSRLARKELKWKPSVCLTDGILKMIKYMKQNMLSNHR